jgi:soluble cytochrome b562
MQARVELPLSNEELARIPEWTKKMKFNQMWLLRLAVFSAIGMAVPVLRADDDDHGPPPQNHSAGPGDHPHPADPPPGAPPRVSLEREMKAMSHDLKTIRGQVKDPTKNASTLAAVQDLEQHTIAAKSATPHVATTQPTPAANAAVKTDYQGDMINLLRHELDLEDALLTNDNDKAAKAADDLHDLEDQGHKEFRPKHD